MIELPFLHLLFLNFRRGIEFSAKICHKFLTQTPNTQRWIAQLFFVLTSPHLERTYPPSPGRNNITQLSNKWNGFDYGRVFVVVWTDGFWRTPNGVLVELELSGMTTGKKCVRSGFAFKPGGGAFCDSGRSEMN